MALARPGSSNAWHGQVLVPASWGLVALFPIVKVDSRVLEHVGILMTNSRVPYSSEGSEKPS